MSFEITFRSTGQECDEKILYFISVISLTMFEVNFLTLFTPFFPILKIAKKIDLNDFHGFSYLRECYDGFLQCETHFKVPRNL